MELTCNWDIKWWLERPHCQKLMLKSLFKMTEHGISAGDEHILSTKTKPSYYLS